MALTDIFKNSKQNKDNNIYPKLNTFKGRIFTQDTTVEIKAAGLLFGL